MCEYSASHVAAAEESAPHLATRDGGHSAPCWRAAATVFWGTTSAARRAWERGWAVMERSELTHVVGALVFLLLFSNMLCVGLGQSWPELLAFWRRPGLLLRSLLAIDVLIPLALFLIVKALPELGPHVRFAILTMAAASTGPLVLRRLARF